MSSGTYMQRSGFSLIQMSILVAVVGIVMVSILPGGTVGSDAEKNALTLKRMAAIEKATEAFMAMNLRRPCPADGTLDSADVNYGYEAATPLPPTSGPCLGGTPAANFSDAVTITGDTTSGDREVDNLTSTANINVGALVRDLSDTNITDAYYTSASNNNLGTYVTSVDSATQITLDKPAAGTDTTVDLTFSTVVAGMVPFRTLGLPEEYALDGYGRRIMYVVDQRATMADNSINNSGTLYHHITSSANSCHALQRNGLKGAIRILESAASTVARDNTMWALISYGKSGHGAFPAQGSSIANRIDVSGGDNTVIHADAKMNAFLDSAFTAMNDTDFGGELVVREPDIAAATVVPYDNIVWYAEETKNTCCIGKACNLGFNMDLNGSVADPNTGTNVATGDINGDGIQDLVIGHYSLAAVSQGATGPRIWVVFGSKTGWPVASRMRNTNISGSSDPYKGNYGFYIVGDQGTAANIGQIIAVGDISRDGYDDIISTSSRSIIIFGKPYFTSEVIRVSNLKCSPDPGDTLDCTTANSSAGVNWSTADNHIQGIMIQNAQTGDPRATIMADIQGNGYKSAVFSSGATSNQVYVLYDQPMSTWDGSGKSTRLSAIYGYKILAIGNANLTSSLGYKIIGDATYPIGDGRFNMAAGDLNNDGYEDLVIGSSTYAVSGANGAVYVFFSNGAGTLGGGYIIPEAGGPGTGPVCINLNPATTTCTNGGANTFSFDGDKAVLFTSSASGETILGHAVTVADFNRDGYADIAMATDDRIYGFYGAGALDPKWTGTINIATAPADFIINTTTSRPGVIAGNFPTILKSGDMNNDGKPDLILGLQDTDLTGCGTKGDNTGSVYVVLQPSAGYPASETDLFDSATLDCTGASEIYATGFPGTFRIDGSERSLQAYIPAAADFNGDGKTDIVVGSPGFYTGATNFGGILVLYGRENVPWDPVIDATDFDY